MNTNLHALLTVVSQQPHLDRGRLERALAAHLPTIHPRTIGRAISAMVQNGYGYFDRRSTGAVLTELGHSALTTVDPSKIEAARAKAERAQERLDQSRAKAARAADAVAYCEKMTASAQEAIARFEVSLSNAQERLDQSRAKAARAADAVAHCEDLLQRATVDLRALETSAGRGGPSA